MFVRWLITAVVVPALLIAGCGGSSDDHTTTSTTAIKGGPAGAISGSWTGRLTQSGLAPFQIGVVITPRGTGRVAYTGIDCAGEWEPRHIMSPQSHLYDFTERINRGAGGNCKGSGRVSTALDATNGEERLHYAFKGGGVTSRGLLHPTDAAGLKPIFDEAGVTPP